VGLLAFDIGAPIALYYVLHAAGVSNLMALTASALLPAGGAAVKLARTRRVDTVALVVLATIVVSILVSVVAHSSRFLLAKEGIITGLWGLWFLATVPSSRPAAFLFARPLMEGRKLFEAPSWDLLWEREAQFRRIWRTSSVIWGLALLTDAAIRVVMSYSLPISVVPGLGGALWPVTFIAIQLVTNLYYHRAGLYRLLGARWPSGRNRRADT
jgi:hypothetical protein